LKSYLAVLASVLLGQVLSACSAQVVGTINTFAGGGQGDNRLPTRVELREPYRIAFDANGTMYIADRSRYALKKMAADGTVTSIGGRDGVDDQRGDGPVEDAEFLDPVDVAFDTKGNLYVATVRGHTIRKVDTQGFATTYAGSGVPGFSGDGGPATQATLNGPYGLAVDSHDNLYISDGENHRVRKVDTQGIITTFAGTGTAGFSGDGGPATSGMLNHPDGLAVDSSDNLYIADSSNNRIRKVAPNGTITTVAGSGVVDADGNSGFTGDGGPATLAQLAIPRGVAVDKAGNLYIADNVNARVRKVDPGGIIQTVAGNGFSVFNGDALSALETSLNDLTGVAVDGKGKLYLVEHAGGRVRTITSEGKATTVIGGASIVFEDGIDALQAQLSIPTGVAFDSKGNLYIADTNDNLIRKVDQDGKMQRVAGTGQYAFGGDDGPALAAALAIPASITLDKNDNLYIVDTYNQRIRKVDQSGIIKTVAGSEGAGFSGDGGPATAALLNFPRGAVVDAQGNLFIADTNNHRIRKVDTNGIITTVAGSGVVDADGNSGFSGEGGPAASAQLNFPSDVVLDPQGRLLIADTQNARIRRIEADGNIKTIAGVNNNGGAGDGGLATEANLGLVSGLAFSPGGNLLFTAGSTVRRINTDGTITTVAGINQSGLTGDGGPAYSATMRNPSDIAVASNGDVYIADSFNERIRRVNGVGDKLPPMFGNPLTATVGSFGSQTFSVTPNNPPIPVAWSMTSGSGTITPDGLYQITEKVPQDTTATVTAIATDGSHTPATVTIQLLTDLVITPSRAITYADRTQKFTTAPVALPVTWTVITGKGSIDPNGVYHAPPADQILFNETAVIQATTTEGTNRIARTVISILKPTFIDTTLSNLASPWAVLVDEKANVLVSETNPAVCLEKDGQCTPVAGTHVEGYSGDGGPAIQAQLKLPKGIAKDLLGNLYIADSGNHRVRKVDSVGKITTVAGGGAVEDGVGDGLPAVAAQLDTPEAVAVDAKGNLYIADYLAHRVRKVDLNGFISTFAGTGTPGYSGDFGPATRAQLNGPRGVTIDSVGNLFIADYGNNRVRKVISNGTIFTFAGTGTSGSNGDGGPASQAELSGPIGLSADIDGSVYISEYEANRVRLVKQVQSEAQAVNEAVMTTLAGVGQPGYSGDAGLSLNASLNQPVGLALDKNGNLLVVDTGNKVVRTVPLAGSAGLIAGTTLPGGVVRGDVTGDQLVNVQDAVLEMRAIVGLATFNQTQTLAGDYDVNGKISIQDVILILLRAVGIIPG
jgi:sugar lactone lactonase YvrE